MIKTSLISIYKKIVAWDKKLEIYINGEDNAYPERVERFRNNSVTASMASSVMTQYLIGKGYGKTIDTLEIGSNKLIEVADDIARDIVDHKGVFIQVNYNALFEVSDWKVLPFVQCRIGKKDSKDYNGKILVCEDWSANKIDKSKVKIFNIYNPDKKIVEYQIEKAGSIENYIGQVLFINMDSQYFYPLSRIDSVMLECDNEYQASVYKNELLRRGFFGKTLVVTRPLISQSYMEDKSTEGISLLRKMENERDEFKKGLKRFISAGEAGGVMHLEVDFAGDNLDQAILFKNIESNINDALFKFTEDSASQRILMAFNNLPIGLVKSPDSALLGNSGESMRVMKETYWENTNKERSIVESIQNELLSKTGKNNKVKLETISLIPQVTAPINNQA